MKATLFVVVVPLLLAGCASPSPLPEVLPHKSPVKAGAKVPRTHHHATLTGYTHREPVVPEAWVPEDGAEKEKCEKPEGEKNECSPQ